MKNVTDQLIEELETLYSGSLSHTAIPSSVTSLLKEVLEKDDSTPRQGGCNDPFQIFGFLAFLLVILQLLANNNGNRRRRSLDNTNQESCFNSQKYENLQLGEQVVYNLLRGFITAVKSGEGFTYLSFLVEKVNLVSFI